MEIRYLTLYFNFITILSLCHSQSNDKLLTISNNVLSKEENLFLHTFCAGFTTIDTVISPKAFTLQLSSLIIISYLLFMSSEYC